MMSNETDKNDPGYDPNTDHDNSYQNPNNIDASTIGRHYFDRRLSDAKPTTAYNVNDELSGWNDRIRLTLGLGLAAQRVITPTWGSTI
ncbi:hypothetical protein N5V81_13880 [Escherichia coli]|nr:hypothetical protein [Escherichia coli]